MTVSVTGLSLLTELTGDDYGIWGYGEEAYSQGDFSSFINSSPLIAATGFDLASVLGQEATKITAVYTPAGFALALALGSAGTKQDSIAAITGLALAAALGTQTSEITISVLPNGLALVLTLGAESVILSPTIIPTGIDLTAALGTALGGVTVYAIATGLDLAAALGTVDTQLSPSVAVTGLALTFETGAVTYFELSPVLLLTGIELEMLLSSIRLIPYSEVAPGVSVVYTDRMANQEVYYVDK